VNRRRGKRLTFLIASAALAVLLGAAFASKDDILTTWYAHRLQSEDVDDRRAAIASLGRLRTRRAARVLAAYLVEAKIPLRFEAAQALKAMADVAMEPAAERFRAADECARKPQHTGSDLRWDFWGASTLLAVLLELRREEPTVKSLLENIGCRLGEVQSQKFKHLQWISGVQPIEGKPCRIFLFAPDLGGGAQTVLITDAGGRLITWKEVGGEPMFGNCELETINGAAFLNLTCLDSVTTIEGISDIPRKYTYRLTLRGIEEQR
jgi:hypothetical protein